MLDQCWSTIYDAGSIVPHWVDVSCLLGDIYDKGCIHTRVKLRILQKSFQANAKHLYNICKMSAKRLRRWSNIEQILYKCFLCLLSCSCLHIQSVPSNHGGWPSGGLMFDVWSRWYNQPLYRHTPYHWHVLYYIISADNEFATLSLVWLQWFIHDPIKRFIVFNVICASWCKHSCLSFHSGDQTFKNIDV